MALDDSNVTELFLDEEATAMTNGSGLSDQEELMAFRQQMEKVVAIVAPIFFAIVVFVGFFGNLLVVLVVTFNRQMRNTTNLLILNLALADIFFIVFCVPFTATGYALPHDWPFGDFWCKLVQFLIIVTAYVSIYTLVFMSLDRFLAVVYPIESMTWRTESHCRAAIACTWMFTIMFCLPLLSAHGEFSPPNSEHAYCLFQDNSTISFMPEEWELRWSWFAFQISFFITAYCLPLIIICGLYSVMLHRLWNQAPGGRASAESIKNKKRVIKMVLIVVVIFALSWLPIHVILVLRAMKLYVNTPASITLQIISHILAYSNSCVNPILYAFLSEPFRRGFWAVITCIRPSGPHGMNQNGYEMTQHDAANRKKLKAEAQCRLQAAANKKNGTAPSAVSVHVPGTAAAVLVTKDAVSENPVAACGANGSHLVVRDVISPCPDTSVLLARPSPAASSSHLSIATEAKDNSDLSNGKNSQV